MLDDTFAEAIIHRRGGHTVLGRRLRPFSRWHLANLDFIESPFLGHPTPLDFPALYAAVRCCRLRYPAHITHRIDPIGRAARLLSFRKYWKHFLREIRAFTAYVADYSSRPVIITTGEENQALKIPAYLYEVAALLQRDRELTKAKAWDMPIGEGAWWLTAHAIAAGVKLDLLTPEDRQQLAALGIDAHEKA